MTSAQGRPLLLAEVDCPLVIRTYTGGSNTSKNYLDLARFLLCPGDKSQGPGALCLPTFQAWADPDEDTG